MWCLVCCWWLYKISSYRGCYFQAGRTLKLGLSITSAFRIALNTWASWVETTINTNKTHVFFRTYEPSHWRYAFENCTDKDFCFFFFPFLNPDKMATICRWLTVNYYRDKNWEKPWFPLVKGSEVLAVIAIMY